MSYKTLIIIDDSDTVSTLNREIIKETLKYVIINEDDVCKIGITTVSNNGQLIVDFDDTKETKIRAVDNISYVENKESVKDVLMNTILTYKENDFAERDIVIISDGHATTDSYTAEELYFELSSGQYPVYALLCEQDTEETDLRELSSIARIGGGKIFHTKSENDESSEEIKLGDQILTVLSEKHESESGDSEEILMDEAGTEYEIEVDSDLLNDDEIQSQDYLGEADYASDDIYDAENNSESVIYERDNDKNSDFKVLLIPVGLIIFLGIVIYFAGQRNRKKKVKEQEEELINTIKNSINKKNEGAIHYAERETQDRTLYDTRCLNEEQIDDDGGTRLLYQAVEGVDITLEDRADPTKYFRGLIRDRIIIGRSPKFCDIPLTYDDSVSQRHCELFLRENDVYIRDLSSSNGTYVNGQKVYQEIKLNSGDIIKIGQLSLFIQIVRRGMGG